jgi:pyrroloquinoline quinone (PQQ) biosynthesis protein C
MAMKRHLKLVKPHNGNISAAIDSYAERLGADILAVDWRDRDTYAHWMAQHYYLVKRTMRYICLGCGLSDPDDDRVYNYWSEHLKEEHNHHKFLERDAKSIGLDLKKISVDRDTTDLVDNIFEGMFVSKGIYLFGYAILLEGLSCKVGKAFTDSVIESHGKAAASFLKLHSAVDTGDDGHYRHGKEFIESLSEEDQQVVLEALKATYDYYSRILAKLNSQKAGFRAAR